MQPMSLALLTVQNLPPTIHPWKEEKGNSSSGIQSCKRKYTYGDFIVLQIARFPKKKQVRKKMRGGVAQCVTRLIRNMSVVGSNPIKGSRCFLEQDTLPSFLSTSWFQERDRSWFRNRTDIHRGSNGRFTKIAHTPCPSLNIVKTKQHGTIGLVVKCELITIMSRM